MCGICFICILSEKSQANEHNSVVQNQDDFACANAADVDPLNGIDSSGSYTYGSRSQHEEVVSTLFADPLLHHRGPDISEKHVFTLTEGLDGYMQGCVLHLRGHLTPQPIKDTKGNALMWNGEIFDGIQVEDHENDTQVLFSHLASSVTDEDILKTMQKVHGPWAFIFWQPDTQKLWFGRDMFGRRSLLWHLPSSNSDHLVLSSVALGEMTYTEIPSVGIFCLDFSKVSMTGGDVCKCPLLTLYPWKHCRWPGTSVKVIETEKTEVLTYLCPNFSSCLSVCIDRKGILDSWIPDVNQHFPETDASLLHNDFDAANSACLEDMLIHILKTRSDLDALAEELIQVLQLSVDKRVNNLPRGCSTFKDSLCQAGEQKMNCGCPAVHNDQGSYSAGFEHDMSHLSCHDSKDSASFANVAILFSGGLDSTVLAALADRCVPEGEPIDLLNVAFEQPVVESTNKKKAKDNKKKQKRNRERTQNITGSESRSSYTGLSSITHDISGSSVCPLKHDVSNNASKSRHANEGCGLNGSGATDQSIFYQDLPSCATNPSMSEHLHACSKINNDASNNSVSSHVNFERDATSSVNCQHSFNVPDRQTGKVALSELNPKRLWNFVEINISQAELQDLRKSHIRKLIYPLQTVLDDSIGCAVWFAARGSGVLPHEMGRKFVSRARVVLCGMAADEQFAGYSRHRVTFKTKGWEGLLRELQEEMWRISARNLGRDDRIITDHSKECRFPFLDETFTQFISSIPVYKRADLRLPQGVGDKLLLRLCALKLGLVKTASQPKRAIQFGSKIAKLDRRKEKGSDVCDRLI